MGSEGANSVYGGGKEGESLAMLPGKIEKTWIALECISRAFMVEKENVEYLRPCYTAQFPQQLVSQCSSERKTRSVCMRLC